MRPKKPGESWSDYTYAVWDSTELANAAMARLLFVLVLMVADYMDRRDRVNRAFDPNEPG